MNEGEKRSKEYVLKRYADAIEYYWVASRRNKRWYKITRYFTIILGALVTLIASLSSSSFIESLPLVESGFAIATPILAAMLAIVGGFSQNFQFGPTWREMVVTAQRLQKERDRFHVTPESENDLPGEVERLNNLVLAETQGFFERIVGSWGADKAAEGGTNVS